MHSSPPIGNCPTNCGYFGRYYFYKCCGQLLRGLSLFRCQAPLPLEKPPAPPPNLGSFPTKMSAHPPTRFLGPGTLTAADRKQTRDRSEPTNSSLPGLGTLNTDTGSPFKLSHPGTRNSMPEFPELLPLSSLQGLGSQRLSSFLQSAATVPACGHGGGSEGHTGCERGSDCPVSCLLSSLEAIARASLPTHASSTCI